jgi:hypothetical protein
MPTMRKLPLFIVTILVVELVIYFWSVLTSTLKVDNFFAIEPAFIFDKCARNSGRVSSALNLYILLLIGYHGLFQIYADASKLKTFKQLISLFAINHLTHFLFVFQNFKHHQMALDVSENKHGFFTFLCITAFPIILWRFKKLNRGLYIALTLHLCNVSYFIMETFFNKIKPDKPAYHNQVGIVITAAACVYILYRFTRDIVKHANNTVIQ